MARSNDPRSGSTRPPTYPALAVPFGGLHETGAVAIGSEYADDEADT
jgi:hypothetical protein